MSRKTLVHVVRVDELNEYVADHTEQFPNGLDSVKMAICLLLNTEWPRSVGARLASLEQLAQVGEKKVKRGGKVGGDVGDVGGGGKVRDVGDDVGDVGGGLVATYGTTPCANPKQSRFGLVLFEDYFVCGFGRISEISDPGIRGVLLESLIVKPACRNKGYGRLLVDKVESFAVQRYQYQCAEDKVYVYLSTHDKQTYYAHLGYEAGCSPVSTLGPLGRFAKGGLHSLMGGSKQQVDPTVTWMRKRVR